MKRSSMPRAAHFHLVTLLPLGVLAAAVGAGCSAPPESSTAEAATGTLSEAVHAPGGHEHLMLTDQARAAQEVAQVTPEVSPLRSTSKLTYYGGPVIQNVQVIPVYWNSKVALQSSLNAFYSAVSTGQYMSFFSQYDTSSPSQTIGNGSRGTPFVDSETSTKVTDAQVQAELNRLFSAGSLPAPNNNRLYMVHFPPGTTITDSGGSASCVVFCAYHGTYVRNGQDVYYGIIPDLGSGGCQSGCGGSTVVNNTTSVSSHEFAEAITDPAVGLATTYGPPLGWYNRSKGEIGDICNGQQTTTTLSDGKTYTVQKLFSNATSSCVTP
ncbi:MAG TPA: hypothetical protein VGI39_34100 [Polyangiaceae bacterium]|jgi:hypothetical protein